MAFDTPTVITLFVTLLIFIACVFIHYEGLRVLTRWAALGVLQPRQRIATLICAQFVLHIVEISIFAAGFFLLVNTFEFGTLVSIVQEQVPQIQPSNFGDYIYYSAVVYTTLGMGEIVPLGPIRILTGMEAVSGLLLITWSASFTFIEMQRYWGRG